MKTNFDINFNDKVYIFLTEYGKERFRNQELLKNIDNDNKLELSLKELSFNMGHLFFNGSIESIEKFEIHSSKYPNFHISLNAKVIVKLTKKGKIALRDNYKQYDIGGGYVDKLIDLLTQDTTQTELHNILFTFSEVAMNEEVLFEKEIIHIEES